MRCQTKKAVLEEKEKQQQQTGEAQETNLLQEKGKNTKGTHMPFPDWCTHCMMGRCGTHHHVSKKRSEDSSRRPITAVDSCFLKSNSTPNSQTIRDESVTCIAVKEDRHQNIIIEQQSVKKGIEELWASERVA